MTSDCTYTHTRTSIPPSIDPLLCHHCICAVISFLINPSKSNISLADYVSPCSNARQLKTNIGNKCLSRTATQTHTSIELRFVIGYGSALHAALWPIISMIISITVSRAAILSDWTSKGGWPWFPHGYIPPLHCEMTSLPRPSSALLAITAVQREQKQNRACSHSNKHLLIRRWLIPS